MNRRPFKSGCFCCCYAILLGSLLLRALCAQTELPIDGTVTAADGQPLVDVFVYGSKLRSCCPIKIETTKTDSRGHFRLGNPGLVVHFEARKFQPRAVVIQPNTSNIRVELEPSTNELVVQTCVPVRPDHRRIGWGEFGPQFDVSIHDMEITIGTPDVDYVRHMVQPKNSKSYMEFWFGPTAIAPEPDDDLLVRSVSFSQRNIVTNHGEVIGMDSWGQLPDSRKWRRAVIAAEGGAVYKDVPPETADLFDGIVNSVCWTEPKYTDPGYSSRR